MKDHIQAGILIIMLSPFLWLSGCGTSPERWLIGRWEMDVAAVRDEIQHKIDQETDEGSPGRAFQQAFLAAAGMQQRELIFSRNGKVRVVVRGDPEQIPWPGGGAVLHTEEAEWQAEAVEDAPGVLRVRITGGERQFADWRADLHFIDKNRFYYYSGEDLNVREYWVKR